MASGEDEGHRVFHPQSQATKVEQRMILITANQQAELTKGGLVAAKGCSISGLALVQPQQLKTKDC